MPAQPTPTGVAPDLAGTANRPDMFAGWTPSASNALSRPQGSRAPRLPRGFASRYEVVDRFPAPPAPLTQAKHWRSTLVLSSIQTLREFGYFERYASLLPSHLRDELPTTLAGSWLSMEAARHHYGACEALGLSRDEIMTMGLRSGQRAQGSVFLSAARLATGVGVSPWALAPLMRRLWERAADGGSGTVYRVGPKESIVETVGCDLFDIVYFRVGFAAVMLGLHRLFSRQAYVHDLTRARDECVLRFQWV